MAGQKKKNPIRKYILANQSPDPDNILWENIYTGGFDRFIRRFLSVGVTIILLVGTFLLIAYTRE